MRCLVSGLDRGAGIGFENWLMTTTVHSKLFVFYLAFRGTAEHYSRCNILCLR